MLPLDIAANPRAKEEAEQLLTQVGLGQRLTHYPSQLSGGEQQRVAIARAFASRPRILFADEPTGNLDPKTGAAIIDLMFDLNQRLGTTLVLVTHDAQLARRCQRRLTMVEGQLHED
jgi:putative ABC transport system ATP-binding protein